MYYDSIHLVCKKKREFKVERENFSLVLHLLSEFSASKEKVRLQSIKAFKKVPWAQLFCVHMTEIVRVYVSFVFTWILALLMIGNKKE